MNTLGIETSGRTGSVALCRDGRILGTRSLFREGRRHAQTLVAELDALAREAGILLRDVDGVAVSIGPGSFTGLRVGVSCAKTLAYATGCPIAAVDTFLCIAEAVPSDVNAVWVIADAQRGDLFVGRYLRGEDGFFARQGEIEIVEARRWCGARSGGDVVSGPGLDKYADDLDRAGRLIEPERRHPRAETVARLGERQIAAGAPTREGWSTADLWSLEPFYLRPSAAEEKRVKQKP